jgi:phage shock protein A
MGVISRISTLIQAKMSKLLDRAEDPRETLEYSYERQREMLQNVKRGIVEVVTSKKRLELQDQRLDENITRLDQQARQAVTAGREDLARLALQRKQLAVSQKQGLDTQIGDLENEQQKLTTSEQRLTVKIETFRTRKEVIKAQYAAAEAQVRISESVTGLGEEMADVGLAIERAEEKTERLKARAGAIDELVAAGTIDDKLTGRGDLLDRELSQIEAGQGIESELAALKAQIAGPKAAPQLPAGNAAPAAEETVNPETAAKPNTGGVA